VNLTRQGRLEVSSLGCKVSLSSLAVVAACCAVGAPSALATTGRPLSVSTPPLAQAVLRQTPVPVATPPPAFPRPGGLPLPQDVLPGTAAPSSTAIAAAKASSVMPAAPSYVTYGLGDPLGSFLNYWDNSTFINTLKPDVPLSAGIRIIVPWDMYGTSNGSSCIDNGSSGSPYNSQQLADQSNLYYSLLAASPAYDNLNVMLAPSSYGVQLAVNNDLTQPSDLSYECGFIGLVNAVRSSYGFGGFVHEYEVFNEPDSSHICASTAAGYYTDAEVMDAYADGNKDSLVAGAFGGLAMRQGGAYCAGTYIPTYMSGLLNDYTNYCDAYSLCYWPEAISGHPYDDVDNSYASGNSSSQTQTLVQQVNSGGFPGDPIFLTEAAVGLTDPWPAFCAAGSPGDPDVDWIDNATEAACVDDNPSGQAMAAQGWQNLANVSQVFRVYWFQFQAVSNWDSGLLGPSGEARPSECVLIHEASPSWCAANVNDTSQPGPYDQDWQDNPYGSAH
jgi:hypothetical protein